MEVDFKKLRNLALQLEEYAQLEGTEIGESCLLLTQLVSYEPYLSDEFVAALTKEMTSQLENFKENTTIVDDVEKIERPFKRLEWNDYD